MAIIIPSKNTYELDNQKVIDNAVNSVKFPIYKMEAILTDNDNIKGHFADTRSIGSFTSTVYDSSNSDMRGNTVQDWRVNRSNPNYHQFATKQLAFAGVRPFLIDINLEIPKNEKNIYIPNNSNFEFDITVNANKYVGDISGVLKYQLRTVNASYVETAEISLVEYKDSKEPLYESRVTQIPLSADSGYFTDDYPEGALADAESYRNSIATTEQADKYVLSGKVACGCVLFYGFGTVTQTNITGSTAFSEGAITSGKVEEYKPLSISIQVFGKTYTFNIEESLIEEKDESVSGIEMSLNSNKLVQRVEDNNYHSNNAKNVLNLYQKGKENATVLCSISEYFDEYGNLVIDPKNSDKMVFNIYDKVVPHRMNSRGEDEPISKDKHGRAKVFTVLGSNVYYDGAVWQELKLQESEILGKISTPRIYISNNFLNIIDTSGVASNYDVYANDIFISNIDSTSFDLSVIDFETGTNKIYVVAKAFGYDDSDPSAKITYVSTLIPPIISLDGELLTITDLSNKAESFIIHVNDIYAETIYSYSFDISNLNLNESINKITVKSHADGYNRSNFSNPVYYISDPVKLSAPIISISDSILTIFDESNIATEFIIYFDGTQAGTTYDKSFELTRIFVRNGTHSITVKSAAKGYANSDFSNAVSYTIYRESYFEDLGDGLTTYYIKTNDLVSGENYIYGEHFALYVESIGTINTGEKVVYTPIYIFSETNIKKIKFSSSIPLMIEGCGNKNYDGNQAYFTHENEEDIAMGELVSGYYNITESSTQSSTCEFTPSEDVNLVILWIKQYINGTHRESYLPADSYEKINLIISADSI